MPTLARGRIVYPKVAIPDPQGQNAKAGRPFVVISHNEEIEKGGSIQAVGITGELMQSPADHYIILPFGPNAKTGLRQQSAALCTWIIDISPEKLDIGRGYVRADLLEEIVRNVVRLKDELLSQGDQSEPTNST